MQQKLIFTNQVGESVDSLVAGLGMPQVILITDTDTARYALPLLLADSKAVSDARQIIIPPGDTYKNLDTLSEVWTELADAGATRSTVVINFGGGMVSDLGGLAASTFKRGLRCINVPTTLLAAVDASVGGKTAINFNGVKNLIGTFSEPVAAVISTLYLNTLPEQQILSGYAEMLKHGLLDGMATFANLLAFSPVYPQFDSGRLLPLLERSVEVKRRIVNEDYTETGLRKALNLGHTAGHAFEALAMKRDSPVPHGYAVAWGLVVELFLSHLKLGFPSDMLHSFAEYVLENYGAFAITCDEYPALISYMRQDKKNVSADSINFTLLKGVGDPVTDNTASADEIGAALDIYRDLMHLA